VPRGFEAPHSQTVWRWVQSRANSSLTAIPCYSLLTGKNTRNFTCFDGANYLYAIVNPHPEPISSDPIYFQCNLEQGINRESNRELKGAYQGRNRELFSDALMPHTYRIYAEYKSSQVRASLANRARITNSHPTGAWLDSKAKMTIDHGLHRRRDGEPETRGETRRRLRRLDLREMRRPRRTAVPVVSGRWPSLI
jgi:hypothetical protein